MSDIAALLAGIGAMLSALVSGATLWVSVRRGSDRENRRSASVAIEVTKDETVTSIIDRERGEA